MLYLHTCPSSLYNVQKHITLRLYIPVHTICTRSTEKVLHNEWK